MEVTTIQFQLLKLAATERVMLGFMTDNTRTALIESGLTSVEIERELTRFEEITRG